MKGWLERQKQYSGESSTLTWKAHVEWYLQEVLVSIAVFDLNLIMQVPEEEG